MVQSKPAKQEIIIINTKKKFKIIIKIFLYYTICILHNIEICFFFFFSDIFVVFLWYIGILGGQSGSITGCMYQLIFSRIGLKVMHGNYRVFCKPTGSSVNLPGSSLNLPGSSVNLPGSSLNLPGHSLNLPGSSVNQPGLLETTRSSLNLPGSSLNYWRLL